MMGRRNRPWRRRERPGTRAICACFRSELLPYCDGAHLGTGIEPVMVDLDREQEVAWCGCGRSATVPRCDGSHASPAPDPE
jgi:CDGSH-type Zn-finger protein